MINVYKKINDKTILQKFGYNQTLSRNLKGFSLFAASFTYISILTGVFQTFGLGMKLGGPAFSWGWIVVLIGNSFFALNFAELASHYPLSGGIYQYSKYIASPFMGWLTGWTFLVCNIITLTAVPLALQNTLPQVSSIFHLIGQQSNPQDHIFNAVFLALILLIISTLLTSFGHKLLIKINNVVAIIEIVFLLLMLFFLFFHSSNDLVNVVFNTSNKGDIFSKDYLPHFLSAIAVSACYTLYGYDTAGTFAEETKNPNKKSSWGILLSLWSAGIFAWLLSVFALKAVSDLAATELYSDEGMAYIIKSTGHPEIGRIFCLAAAIAIASCTFAVHSNIVRLIFAIARDGLLPWHKKFTYISPRFKTIIFSSIVSGVLAIMFLITQIFFAESFEMIISLAALWANLSYLLVIGSLLYARIKKGWPHRKENFYLGKFALFINIMALLWGIFVVVNLSWPRSCLFAYNPIRCYIAPLLTLLLLLLGSTFWLIVPKKIKMNLENSRSK